MRGTISMLAVAAAVTLSGVSCVRLVGPEDIRDKLGDQAGVKLRQEQGFTVTRSGIWLARKFIDEDEVPLRGVRRVEIGIYEVKGLRRGMEAPARLDLSRLDGWEPVVRWHEEDEHVMVLVKHREDGSTRALLIVVTEPDEWVLVRVRGKLDHVLERTMEMAFTEVERPELYAVSRRERGLDLPAAADAAEPAPGTDVSSTDAGSPSGAD